MPVTIGAAAFPLALALVVEAALSLLAPAVIVIG